MFKNKIYLFFPFYTFFIQMSYGENNRKILDEWVLKAKMKGSDVSFSIYSSDVKNEILQNKMAGEEISEEIAFYNILKHKLAILFMKPLDKKMEEMMDKQIDQQLNAQMKNYLKQCGNNLKILEEGIHMPLFEFEMMAKKSEKEKYLLQQFFENNIKNESISLDSIKDFYNKKKKLGLLEIIPEEYEYWEIKISHHNFQKATEILTKIKENEGDFNAIAQDKEIKKGRISEEYTKENSFFPNNIKSIIFSLKKDSVTKVLITKKGLYIIKKISGDEKKFTCDYIFLPDEKYEKYSENVRGLWKKLKEYFEKKENEKTIEKKLEEIESVTKEEPETSSKFFKDFEISISKSLKNEKKIDARKKKIFNSMQDGTFSEPILFKEGGNMIHYKIFFFVKKKEKHIETLETNFNNLKEQAEADRENLLKNNFMKSLFKKIDVTYNEKFKYCSKVIKLFL